MTTMKKLLMASALLGSLLLNGCVEFYKPDTRQGVILSTSQINAVKVGHTQQQVVQLIGTPPIADPLQTNRWDYVYLFFPDQSRNRGQEKYLTLYFENAVVTKIVKNRWK
jgi:outer membrane protein assembly factor BamE